MKYLLLDSNNTILGYGDNPKGKHQASTSDPIPEYDNNTQSIYWEGDQIVVKDDEQKIAENKERIATQYQRDRQMEYPSNQELVVALYDEEDKQAIIEKRKAVKAKYPKPE